jgi:ankyrin repeat protein
VTKCDDDGSSPILIAAQKGHAPCISQLLASRADPRSSWNGTSALEKARAKGHAECVRVLEAALQ